MSWESVTGYSIHGMRQAGGREVLSDPYVDVALVGMHEPQSVDLYGEILDDLASCIELSRLHDRYARKPDHNTRHVVTRKLFL